MVAELSKGDDRITDDALGNWWLGYFSVLFGMIFALALSLVLVIGLFVFLPRFWNWLEASGFRAPFWVPDGVVSILWIWFGLRFFFPFVFGLNKGGWKSIRFKTPRSVWLLCRLCLQRTFVPFLKVWGHRRFERTSKADSSEGVLRCAKASDK